MAIHATVNVLVRLLLIGVTIFWLIPATSIVLYYYCKNMQNIKGRTFQAGAFYVVFTLLFCINYVANLSYECFSYNRRLETTFLLTSTFFYGTHLILLIALLYSRIYFIFRDTAYKLPKKCIYAFTIVCVFEICDVSMYILLTVTNKQSPLLFVSYLIGLITIMVIVFWITALYVSKLFQIIANNSSDNKINDKLLNNVTKNTVLSLVWISTLFCFWSIPFAFRTRVDFDTYLLLHHSFMLLDVNTNGFTFVLGFQFSHKIYMCCCNCAHTKLKKIFQKLASAHTTDEINITKQLPKCIPKPKLTIKPLKVSSYSASTATTTNISVTPVLTPKQLQNESKKEETPSATVGGTVVLSPMAHQMVTIDAAMASFNIGNLTSAANMNRSITISPSIQFPQKAMDNGSEVNTPSYTLSELSESNNSIIPYSINISVVNNTRNVIQRGNNSVGNSDGETRVDSPVALSVPGAKQIMDSNIPPFLPAIPSQKELKMRDEMSTPQTPLIASKFEDHNPYKNKFVIL